MHESSSQQMECVGDSGTDALRSLYIDEERTSWDVLITPLDDELVVTLFVNHVADTVLLLADVFDEYFLTWHVTSKYANHQDVVA